MADIIKIFFILVLIIYLLKRKWNLGLVMALSAAVLALLYRMNVLSFLDSCFRASTDITTVSLILALTLIRIFENIMRKQGIMQEMMDAFRGIVVDRRIVLASMPALIGLLPSMGGALFSAPMVEEASKGLNISPEKKSFVNYIFRHPWEFISPLYPGLILASAITAHPIREFIIVNIPYAIALMAGGAIWGLSGIGLHKEGLQKITRKGLLSFIPLGLILIFVIIFHLNLSLSMGIVIIILLISYRYSFKNILQACREGFSREIVIIILGVMAFKTILNDSGAVTNISTFFSEHNIPLLPVLFIVPFISGLLTGLTVGFIGSTFPLLTGLPDAQNITALSFAFASGYVGVLLSPVHLCLILTREYFKANMSGIYNSVIKAGILIMLTAFVEYLFLIYK